MKSFYIYLQVTILLSILSFTGAIAQTWTSIDGGGANGIGSPTADSKYPSVAVFNGELYAIWEENFSGVDQIHIKKYNGSTWSPVGNTAGQSLLNTNASNAWSPKIVTCNGALYAAWHEYGDGITRVRVKKYDGSTWTFVENYTVGDGRTNINNLTVALAIKVDMIVFNNELYATWVETEPSGSGIQQIRVAKFNGSVWSSIDGSTFFGINYDKTKHATNSTLCVFNNKLYAAWTESDASDILQLRVKRYDGGSVWTFVDGNGSTGLNYSTTTTLFDGPLSLSSYNGKMYAFWAESNRVRVKRYDETNGWVADPTDGGTGIGWCHTSTNVAYYPASYAYDKLYVTWEQNPIPRQIRVASYDGTTRTFIDGNAVAIGINNTITNRAHFPKLIEYKGDLAAVWSEELTNTSGSANQIRAKIYSLPPFVKSVYVPANGTYINGQALNFTVNFSKNVVVASGTPYIPVTLNTGGTVNATYVSGSGSSSLTFRYSLALGQEDADGISVGTAIAGGTLQSQDATPLTVNPALNNVASTTNIKVDAVVPTITAANLASNNNYIDITFSEGVYGASDGATALSAAKLSLTFTKNTGSATNVVISFVKKNDNAIAGLASALTGGETTVRVFLSISGNSSGVETIAINPANGTSVYDRAGNAMSDTQTSGSVTLNDLVFPSITSITRQTPAAYLTNASSVIYRVTFSENVNGVDAADFSLTKTGTANGVISAISGTGLTRDITVNSITGDGTLRLDLKNSGIGITDNAGNTLSGGYTSGEVYAIDKTSPIASILGLAPTRNNYGIINFQVNFSENVSGVDISDFSLSTMGANGSISSVSASSGTSITVSVIVFSGNGTLELHLNNSGTDIKDAAGNAISGGASSITFFIDKTPPYINTISRITPLTVATKSTTVVYGINFFEIVSGVDVSDFSLTKTGTATGTIASVTGSGGSYEITVNSVSGNGNLRLDLNNSGTGIVDEAGNQIIEGCIGDYYTIDNTAPTVAISSASSNPTKSSPVPVTITFSEAVTGFIIGDISVTNGTASGLSGSGTTYTVNVTPAAQGLVNINVAAGVAADAAGNNNTAAAQFSRTFDNVAPAVAITSSANSLTNISPIPVTIAFSEPVTGFDASDITVTNGTKGTLTGSGANYTMNITPSADGTVTVAIAGSVATDAAGNNNAPATSLNVTFDSQAPGVTISSSVPDPTNANPIPLNIVFTEAITGFTSSDITVNGTVSNLQTTDNIHWTANIIPNNWGAVGITIEAGKVQDLAGNGNTASDYLQRTYDPNEPTVTLSSVSPNPTKDNPVVVKIAFSEIVWNFDLNDIVVTNGTASNLQMLDYHENWTVDITPASDGVVKVDIPAGAAQDYVNNNNKAAAQFTRTCDITSPTVAISSTSANTTRNNPIPLNIVFSEPVTGFTLSDLSVTNGTASNLATSDNTTWTANIAPSANGTVEVHIAAGAAQDIVGNNNSAASAFTRIYDTQSPSVVISSEGTIISDAPKTITITFSEPVTGFNLNDITITNGNASNLTGTGSSYSVAVAATGSGNVLVDIAANVAQDAAGNNSLAASTLSLSYITAPTIASVTPGSRCGAGTVTLEATASAGTINWYANATGGESLGTGVSFTTDALNNTTSFYVDATNLGATTPTRTEVVATIKAIPSVTATTPASRCGNGTVSLEAAASAGTINWYSTAAGGDVLGAGNSFVTPAISANTTYYVEASENGCISASRTAIVATVNNVPEQPSEISGNATVTKGNKEAYNVMSVSGVTYEWTATEGTVIPNSNSAEITWNTNGAQTVTVTPSNNCGAGPARTLNVTVTSSTGINDEPVVAAYKIYPNPARDFVKIERTKDEECTVRIYSFDNKLVVEKTIYAKLEQIEINNLGAGVYTLIVTNKNGERSIHKLVRL